MKLFVLCPACDEEHFTEDIEALNIEEGIQGEDIMTFRCNETDTVQKGIVYGTLSH